MTGLIVIWWETSWKLKQWVAGQSLGESKVTNPELLSIMSLLPALLPCYTFSFVNAENAVLKKKKKEKYRLKKLCCPENRQFVGKQNRVTQTSMQGLKMRFVWVILQYRETSSRDVCVVYLLVLNPCFHMLCFTSRLLGFLW